VTSTPPEPPSSPDPAPAQRTRWHSAPWWGGAVVGMAAIAAVVIALLNWLLPQSANDPPPSASGLQTSTGVSLPTSAAPSSPLYSLSVTIDEPSTDGMDVPHCSTVKGTVKELPSQAMLWLVIEGPNDDQNKGDFFLIAALRIRVDGSWSAVNISLGDQLETGRPFWFQVYAVDRTATSVLTPDPNANLKTLPAGFNKPAVERAVRRGVYNIDQCGTPLSP